MPSEDYFQLPYLSSHALADFVMKGPEYYEARHVKRTLVEDFGRAVVIGSAVEVAVAARNIGAVEDAYALVPADYLTPSGDLSSKKAAQEWVEEQGERSVLTPDELATVQACARNVLADDHAMAVIDGGEHEPELVNENAGIKGCADFLRDDVIVDLKTTRLTCREFVQHLRDAWDWLASSDWHRPIPNFFISYWIQAAQYAQLWPGRGWAWVAVETKTEWHSVITVSLSRDRLAAAIAHWRKAFTELKLCEQSGEWKGPGHVVL